MGFVALKDAEAQEKPKGGFVPIEEVKAPAEPKRFLGGPEDRAAIVDIAKKVGRQVALTGRYITQGVTAPANMIGDALGLRSSETLKHGLTEAGYPEAATSRERISENAVEGMSSAVPLVKGGQLAEKGSTLLSQKVGESLAARPAVQLTAGASSGGATGATREAGGGPVAQTAAGVAGALAPSSPALLAEGVRRAIRGGEAGRQRLGQNIETFEDAGAGTPTVGQGTESRLNRAVESTLSKLPGGSGPVMAKAEDEAAGLGSKIDQLASSLAPRTGAAPAGRQISSGIKEFVGDFKKKSSELYKDLDRFILPDTPIAVGNASKVLDELTTVSQAAPNLSAQRINPKIAQIRGAMADDAKNGYLPYGEVKKLRTAIGEMLESGELVTDAPRAQLKKVYGSLTADMEAAAAQAGPDAVQSLKRANTHYRAGMKRIDDVLDPIMKKGDPEDIFKAAVSGTKEGATTISAVMKSLPDESKKVVAGTMLRRLGLATPGKQNELGEVFSTETFLTNWNKVSPDAKRVLFSSLPGPMRKDLDQIAAVASNLREGSKVFANPSGTSAGMATAGTAGAAVLSLLHMDLATAGGLAAGVLSANMAGRMMTNPAVVHWLAESTKVPVEQLPAQLNVLFQHSLYMKGEERKEVREFVKGVRAARAAAAQPPQVQETGVP